MLVCLNICVNKSISRVHRNTEIKNRARTRNDSIVSIAFKNRFKAIIDLLNYADYFEIWWQSVA